jgi:two-component system, NtrC family, nitrogen regulation response regulator GlnG
MADILVVDDDQSIATAFEHFLRFEGHECRLASNAEDAVRLIAERQPTLIMMDVRMPGVDGLQALRDIRSRFPGVYVVMMTGYGTSQTSIDAIREGAYDYLTKPLDLDELREVIRKALATQQTRDITAGTATDAGPQPALVGETTAMRDVYKVIGRLAAIDVPALVLGEHGTGKQLVIATIHDNSPRRDQPFVSIDCTAVPEGVLEAELFERATGTVQLAGVEALPLSLQARLARALDDSTRGPTAARLQARVIASSDEDLATLVASGAFSRELYHALAVITLHLPALRDRREDIPLLVRHLIQRFNADLNRTIRGVDDAVARMLQEHEWPGNVGELESVIKRACILARSDVITTDEIGQTLAGDSMPARQDVESALVRAVRTALQERLVDSSSDASASAFHDIIDLVETTLVKEALTITNGNQLKAAGVLGVNRATLRKKMPED